MAGARVTQAELDAARAAITEAGLSWERGAPNVCGEPRLSKLLNITRCRANTILDHLREPGKVSGEIGSIEQSEHAIDDSRLLIENRELRRKLNDALAKQVFDQKYQEFVASVATKDTDPPKWTLSRKTGKAKVAMPLSHLSDAHFDEIVDPRQVAGINAYNREIAGLRLRRFFEKSISLCDDYLKGVDYPGFVLPVSGDMFSGTIHDELRETNESSLCESLVYWLGPMISGIDMLADRFGKVFIPWVVGNHPRMTPKPRAKGGVKDNFDWLLGALLQREYATRNKNVVFKLSESFDLSFNIYTTRYLQTHGDQFKGGAGIAAQLSPLFIGDSRKREKQVAINQPYDIMLIGHWHYRSCLPPVKGNGSLKGYDEYAMSRNLKFQSPQQSFWLTTPEHGITMEAPIFVEHPEEGWRNEKNAPVEFAA